MYRSGSWGCEPHLTPTSPNPSIPVSAREGRGDQPLEAVIEDHQRRLSHPERLIQPRNGDESRPFLPKATRKKVSTSQNTFGFVTKPFRLCYLGGNSIQGILFRQLSHSVFAWWYGPSVISLVPGVLPEWSTLELSSVRSTSGWSSVPVCAELRLKNLQCADYVFLELLLHSQSTYPYFTVSMTHRSFYSVYLSAPLHTSCARFHAFCLWKFGVR